MASTVGAPSTEAIDEKAWAMTQPSLYSALHASIDAVRGDKDAVKTLFGALAVTGFAMQYYKSSRPVSGVEHAFSHIWEMEDLSVNGIPVTHGHKVAIGTLSALAFTELFFADPDGPPPVPKSFKRPNRAEREQEVAFSFKDSAAKVLVVKTALNKYMEDALAERVNELIRDSWRELRSRINERLIPYKELKALLERGGCPVLPESINLTRAKTIATAHQAQMSRVRYGILDLAWDMGNFETILRKIEDSDVYLR
jgi:glycerol-1-phosphate dehydrogenase [NAD(P)+]